MASVTFDVTSTSPAPIAQPTAIPYLAYKPWELVHDITYSPDGSLLAVAAGDRVDIYDSGSLQLKNSLSPGAWVNRLAFHPRPPLIALAVKDGSIQFWDTQQGKLVCRFIAHKKGANSLSINPDGTSLITTGTDINSRVWDIDSIAAGGCPPKETGQLIGESFSSPDAAFSPDGRMIALVDLTNIRLRNSLDRKLVAPLLPGNLPIFDIAFSPDGHWLAAAQGNGRITLWDISKPTEPIAYQLVDNKSDSVTHNWRVAFSPDSKTLAGGNSGGQLNLWEISTLQPIKSWQFPRAVTAISFSPDGKTIAVGGLDAQVSLLPFP